MEKIGIRDQGWKKSNPGSRINITEPEHWCWYMISSILGNYSYLVFFSAGPRAVPWALYSRRVWRGSRPWWPWRWSPPPWSRRREDRAGAAAPSSPGWAWRPWAGPAAPAHFSASGRIFPRMRRNSFEVCQSAGRECPWMCRTPPVFRPDPEISKPRLKMKKKM